MRIGSLVLGILGGLGSGLLGMKWLGDANEYAEQLELAAELGVDTGNIVTAAYMLLLAMVAGIVGGVYAAKGKGKIAAAIMLGGGALPAVFEAKALLATFLLLVGGLVALGAKPK